MAGAGGSVSPNGLLGIDGRVPPKGFGSMIGAGAPGSGGRDPKSGIGGIEGRAGKPPWSAGAGAGSGDCVPNAA